LAITSPTSGGRSVGIVRSRTQTMELKKRVGKREGKRPLGRSRRICVDNIKMDLREIGCGGIYWIDLTRDRNRWRCSCQNGKLTFRFHNMFVSS
jgi:hypothetical protein